MGAYLGGVWLLNGNLLTVMVAHALYDFLALLILLLRGRRGGMTEGGRQRRVDGWQDRSRVHGIVVSQSAIGHPSSLTASHPLAFLTPAPYMLSESRRRSVLAGRPTFGRGREETSRALALVAKDSLAK